MAAPGDWTKGKDGALNKSAEYLSAVREVELIMRANGATCLDPQWVQKMAELVVSHLAFGFNFGPLGPPLVLLSDLRQGSGITTEAEKVQAHG